VSLKVRIFRSDKSCLLLVLALALPLLSTGLGDRDLWAPDEPRTGEVTREILRSGSWAVLHDNGGVYVEKPPLFFWLAAAAARAAGRVSEFALRLPSSLAGILGAIALFYLGRGLFGRRVGALAAVVLLTSQDYFMEARWAHPDMLWTLLLTCACLAFHEAHASSGGRAWLLAFYLAMGLAVLTKGPAGAILPILAVLVFLAASRDLAFLRRAGIAWGLPLSLLPSGLWLLAYRASSGSPFPAAEALVRFASRVTQGVHHAHPFPHVLTGLAIEFLPWIVLLPSAVWVTFPRRRERRDRDNVYLYSWVLAVFSVFAVSAEKRGVYLLPLLPLLSLLVARLWDMALLDWDPSPVGPLVAWPLVVGLAITAGATAIVVPRLGRDLPELRQPAAVLAGSLALTIGVALWVHRRLGGGAALATFAGGLAACYLVIALLILPVLDRSKSARQFCGRIAALVGASPLGIYPDPHDAYAFYTGRRVEVLQSREALRAFLESAPRAYCLMEEEQYEVERRALGRPLRVLDRDRVGHRAMVLVSGVSSP